MAKQSSKSRSKRESDRPKQIKEASSLDKYVNMIVFGEPGVQKTRRFVGRTPKTLVLASSEDELVSIEDPTGTDVWPVSDLEAMMDAYEYLRHGGTDDYEWLWFDNGTMWQEQNLDKIMEDLVAVKPHRDRYVPDRPEYLQSQQQLSVTVRNLVALPINFGMTAHVMRVGDEGSEKLIPLFQGGRGDLSQKLCGYMNVVCHVSTVRSKGNDILRGRFHGNSKVLAKDRFGLMPATVDDVSIDIFLEARASGKPVVATKKKKGK